MGYSDLKLTVSLNSIKEDLRLHVANIQKTGIDVFAGNWIHDEKIYDGVVIPFKLVFLYERANGGTGDVELEYTIYYDVDDSSTLIASLSNVLDEDELASLKSDILLLESYNHVEGVTFYDLEII